MWLMPACIGSAVVLGQTAAHAQSSSGRKAAKPPLTRKSTDAPIRPEGKLGQDLFIAVGRGDLPGVRSLLKRGADPNARNGLLFVPLDLAAATGQVDVMKALIESGAKVEAESPYGTPLTFATVTGVPPAYFLLVSRGARINPVRTDGATPLMYASRSGAVPVVDDLLHRGAPISVRDNSGATALIWAAREGQIESGRRLLDAGASADSADSIGWTPLMHAAVNGHAEFVQMLLDKGAKPNARDKKSRTALLLSAMYGDHPDVIRALLKGGANEDAAEAGQSSAYAVALDRGHTACAGALTKRAPGAMDRRRTPEEAVQASLKLVQHSIGQFNKRTGCISCHHEGLGRMATGTALDHGFALDPEVNRPQMARLTGAVDSLGPLHARALNDPEVMKTVPLIEIDEVSTTDTWLLGGLAAHKQPPTEAAGAMAMVLARQQSPDGNWHFALPRVPMQSSFFTFTALSIKNMRDYAPQSFSAEVTDRIARAKAWLLKSPTMNSEDRTFRLLGLKWAGATEQETMKAAEELKADQRPDGGWSQVPALQSDAYATGEALYALHAAAAMPVADPIYARGVQFLLRTQDEDGSWFVNKRALPLNNYFDGGFPHGVSQYSSFNGTCWAMIALLQTIDRPRGQARGQ